LLPWALVFGALISPTDPVAVLATLKEVKVPEDLQIVMTGETFADLSTAEPACSD